MLQCLRSTWACQRVQVQKLSKELCCSWVLGFYRPDAVLHVLCLQKSSARVAQHVTVSMLVKLVMNTERQRFTGQHASPRLTYASKELRGNAF